MSNQGLLSRWSVRPQPLRGESLESWLIRIAFSYPISLGELLFQVMGVQRSDLDLDLIDSSSLAFLHFTQGIRNFDSASMVLWSLAPKLGSNWKARVTPRHFRRYCPMCFETDSRPYLRLIWRLNFIVACAEHGVFLEHKCLRCGASFDPGVTNNHFSMGRCWTCGGLLSGPGRTVDLTSAGFKATTYLLRMTGNENHTPVVDLFESPEDLFEALEFLVRYQERIETGRTAKLTTQRAFNIEKEEETLLVSIGNAWSLLEDRTRLAKFARRHQARFNSYVRWSHGILRQFRTKHVVKTADWTSVDMIVSRMEADGVLPTQTRVARLARIDPDLMRLKGPAELKEKVKAARKSVRRKQLDEMTEYILSSSVCKKVPASLAAQAISLNPKNFYQFLVKNPAFKKPLIESRNRTNTFYARFGCATVGCTGTTRLRGFRRRSGGRRALIYCTKCGVTRQVDISQAPSHRNFK